MKCSGDNVILRGIFHVVHIMFSTKFYVLLRKFGLLFGQCRKLCISTNRGLGQVGLTPLGWSYVVLFTNCIIGYMIITRFELQISPLPTLEPQHLQNVSDEASTTFLWLVHNLSDLIICCFAAYCEQERRSALEKVFKEKLEQEKIKLELEHDEVGR